MLWDFRDSRREGAARLLVGDDPSLARSAVDSCPVGLERSRVGVVECRVPRCSLLLHCCLDGPTIILLLGYDRLGCRSCFCRGCLWLLGLCEIKVRKGIRLLRGFRGLWRLRFRISTVCLLLVLLIFRLLLRLLLGFLLGILAPSIAAEVPRASRSRCSAAIRSLRRRSRSF